MRKWKEKGQYNAGAGFKEIKMVIKPISWISKSGFRAMVSRILWAEEANGKRTLRRLEVSKEKGAQWAIVNNFNKRGKNLETANM